VQRRSSRLYSVYFSLYPAKQEQLVPARRALEDPIVKIVLWIAKESEAAL
jgi:hypothetical protein